MKRQEGLFTDLGAGEDVERGPGVAVKSFSCTVQLIVLFLFVFFGFVLFFLVLFFCFFCYFFVLFFFFYQRLVSLVNVFLYSGVRMVNLG